MAATYQFQKYLSAYLAVILTNTNFNFFFKLFYFEIELLGWSTFRSYLKTRDVDQKADPRWVMIDRNTKVRFNIQFFISYYFEEHICASCDTFSPELSSGYNYYPLSSFFFCCVFFCHGIQ